MQSTKLIVLNGSFGPASHSGLNTTSAAAPTILQLASLLWGIHLGILFHTLDTLDYGPLLSLGMPIRVSQKNQKSEFWNVLYPSGFHRLDEPPEKISAL